MKKYILFLVVIVLVLAAIGISRANPVWAGILPVSLRPVAQPATGIQSIGLFEPPAVRLTVTGNGIYNVGGVCTIEVDFKASNLQVLADAEVPVADSLKVPFTGAGKLLFPGCHFIHYKQAAIVNQLAETDGTARVCFGASPYLAMTIYYYLDNPNGGIADRTWIPTGDHFGR